MCFCCVATSFLSYDFLLSDDTVPALDMFEKCFEKEEPAVALIKPSVDPYCKETKLQCNNI